MTTAKPPAHYGAIWKERERAGSPPASYTTHCDRILPLFILPM